MLNTCCWCGRKYDKWHCGVGWKWYSYCSKKCEIEAERADQRERRSSVSRTSSTSSSSPSSSSPSSSSPSSSSPSSSSSSASKGGPIQAILGLIILIAICWGGWKICKGCYNWLFGSREFVVTEAMMMESWQEHIERRCEAFSDGLSEKEVEAKGLKNYSWEEWKNRQLEKMQTPSPEKTNAEVIGDKSKEILQSISTSGVKDVGEKAKVLWQNITSQEKKDPEEELKKLNARHAELEGDRKTIAVRASNSTSCDVQFSGDECIVTVISEYGSRASAWQAAVRSAVETAVINFVRDSRLLTVNHIKLKERLDTIDKTDIKRLDILKDQQVGEVFTVKIRAAFDKKSLAPKFKDIFPDDFDGGEAVAPVVTPSALSTSATSSERTSQPTVDPVTPKTPSSAATPVPAVRSVKPQPAPAKPVAPVINSELKVPESDGVKSPGRRASTESKRISITVNAKGKTEAMALRNAFREAVFKTAGTWVGSKERIKENREKLIEQVMTVTEVDIAKYEVLETSQEADGTFVLKVKVSVSKKKIAPKLAPVFPDVFDVE